MPPKPFLSVKDSRYQTLLTTYKKASPEKTFLQIQADVGKMWREDLDRGQDRKLFDDKIKQLTTKIQGKGNIMFFMRKASENKESSASTSKEDQPKDNKKDEQKDNKIDDDKNGTNTDKEDELIELRDLRKETNVQDALKKKIQFLQNKMLVLLEERDIDTGMMRARINEDIKNTKDELEKHQTKLKRNENMQKATQKYRQKKKQLKKI